MNLVTSPLANTKGLPTDICGILLAIQVNGACHRHNLLEGSASGIMNVMETKKEGIMATMLETPSLVAGDRLTRDEFLRRWEEMPEVKKAELIGGVVYMSSPVSDDHGQSDLGIGGVLWTYVAHTPGTAAASNATWYMLRDAPQPDTHLRILAECGGNNRKVGKFLRGAPELCAETCLSSTAYDLHPKKDLYEKAGVQEYLVILLHEREVRWHRLTRGAYKRIAPTREGILHSSVFPGLWLNVPAFLGGDMRQVLNTLNQGLQSPEHTAFVEKLAKKRK